MRLISLMSSTIVKPFEIQSIVSPSFCKNNTFLSVMSKASKLKQQNEVVDVTVQSTSNSN